MSFADDYRTNAEDCLRMAKTAAEERDRPLWATMAQSWLRLAEHAERLAPASDADHVECVTLAPEDLSGAEAAGPDGDEAEEAAVSPRATN